VGNDLKVEKTLAGYDEDAKLTIDYLVGLETCNGKIGATGRAIVLAVIPR
jgi:carboxymethylenebutenolidase